MTTNVKKLQQIKSENTRKRIIDSALKLLEVKGYSKTNIIDIAKGADITVGAFQHHFPTKDALLEVLVLEVLSPLNILNFSNVWPNLDDDIVDRANYFVNQVWDQIYGKKSYIASWSLILGCRANKKLFDMILEQRTINDPVFNSNFLKYFPEIIEGNSNTDHFPSFIYSTLRGMAVLEVFNPDRLEVENQLNFIKKTIIMYASNRL